MTQCQSVSTFESEVQNSLSALEPHSTDSLYRQHHTKKLSPKIALHFKMLCESKAMLPMFCDRETSRNIFAEIRSVIQVFRCALSPISFRRNLHLPYIFMDFLSTSIFNIINSSCEWTYLKNHQKWQKRRKCSTLILGSEF